ncbi:hypothetical protein A3A79_01710 [Candidatus Gottesmanbacteria bacterium RIFCSPLOWO2_01_FULL_43_11b]|uniref:Glycosyltransferase 2-like domain-containing protein n=1 Tax=Candidatus Gottesmanbacteria bacterium RIFCSPLOWO2_01_FULL_43_11b TaxID=1798392 RepID=A0A1F6AH19_9BACT|nr:MAG: hypothetical protein A3A79_01710 [Candidatus Gottesmanbacteria bacterium RIFCSPLOWO2_01_FULL_43_11b]
MPIYNGSRFMGKAIDSILAQTYHNFELIVVDDGSTDTTLSILKNYKKNYPNKIRLFCHSKNIGAFAATNLGFTHAKGVYIGLMDCDDISNPSRLEKEVTFLQNHPDVILVGTQAKIIDDKGKITGQKIYPNDHEEIYKAFAWINPIVHPSAMINRALLPKNNYLYHTNFGVNSDYYSFFEWLNYGKFANLPEFLLSYRVHGGNSSLQNLKQRFYTITKIRLAAVKHLNYRFPSSAILKFITQHVLVSLLPERLLLPLYLTLRGMRKVKLPNIFKISRNMRQLKRYALSTN